jgi:hypothetical protein|tara:strand:+ start:911 stop:2206 length:1296 start_codon:yes stop_codon:yes gene_type:complete
MVGSAFIPPMTLPGQIFTKIPLSAMNLRYEEIDFAQPFTQISGSITKTTGSATLSGVGTLFLTELNFGDYVFFMQHGDTDSAILQQIIFIGSDTGAKVDPSFVPLAGDVDYVGVPVFRYDIQPPATLPTTLFLDPTAITASKTGRRYYYSEFYAWNWNTNTIENMAQTYAASIGVSIRDIGWEDEAGWVLTTNNILTYGGWNATITTVAPDPLLINNANQEIVLYYTTGNLNFNGLATSVVDSLSFIEQSNVAQDYKTQLGTDPFQSTTSTTTMQIDFDGTEFFGAYVASPSQTNPTGLVGANFSIAALNGDDNVGIATLASSYDSTSTFELENQDFAEGQFQVFMKYVVYDGFEAVAAEKLTEQGIQVTPENVDWYRKSVERLAEVQEIEWPFDEDEAPEQENPESYTPEEYDPSEYHPRNATESDSDGN